MISGYRLGRIFVKVSSEEVLHSGMVFEKLIVCICFTELFYTLAKHVFLIYGNHRIAIDLKE